jgi:hypothetical protein
MSYDLVVFDPNVAPRERGEFIAWFQRQTEWSEGHAYDDPAVTTPALRGWYEAIRQDYPNLNGPGAADDDHVDDAVDYSIGKNLIYAAFRWTQAEDAYPVVRRLAVEHQVGFYDVSGDEGDGEIYFPGDTLRPPSGGAWREVAKQFRDLEGNQ